MRNILSCIILWGVMLGISACTWEIDPAGSTAPIVEATVTDTPIAEPVDAGIGLTSVIFDAKQAEAVRSWTVPESTGAWTPTPQEINGLETKLIPFLQSVEDPRFRTDPPIWERLEKYNIQYLGLEENGQQIIYANFFCATMANDNWIDDFYLMEDGGDCAFQMKYNVENETFYDLYVNGEA